MPALDIFGLMARDYTRAGLELRSLDVIREIRDAAGDKLAPGEQIDTWIVLGTGWGDEVQLEIDFEAELQNFSIFRALPRHPTHKRLLQIGWMMVDGKRKRVGVIRGRIHLNDNVFMQNVITTLVRLLYDVIIRFGAKYLILTASCGACHGAVPSRTVLVAKKFLAFGGSELMPLYGGEFNAPATALSLAHIDQLRNKGHSLADHIYWLGPHFETTEDKAAMAERGADVVGMSLKPGLSIVAAHLERRRKDPDHWCDPNLRVTPLIYVSNTHDEHPDDAEIRRRGTEDAPLMAEALETTLGLCV